MNEHVKGSRFLMHSGGSIGSLNYYAVDDEEITDQEIFDWLVKCGAWLPMVDEGNPVIDLRAVFTLAERQELLHHNALYWSKHYEAWCVGYAEYGGGMDPLSLAHTPQRAICLFLLRYPEIDRLVNTERLPYVGWAARYKDKKD